MTTNFSAPFLDAAERHTAWGAAQLEALNRFLPEGPWTADLDACVYRQGGREIRVAVLATYDSSDQSWLWGWANPGLRGTPVVKAAEQVERFGRAHGIREFIDEEIDLSGFADSRRAAETLAFAAMGVIGAAGYVGVQAGPDTLLYLLPDDPQVPRADVDAIALPRVLTTGAGLIGRSARQVVAGYFDHYGLPQRQGESRISADLPSGATAEVEFDGADRIAAVRVSGIGP